jgi:glycosyltransferase involved in cell wall biosynthesis
MQQTYPRIEIVVVDHNSTDHTRDVIRSFGESVRYCRHTGGFHDTFNVWRDIVRGDFISVLDDDDYITPTCIETLAEFLVGHEDVDIVFSRHRFFSCEEDRCYLMQKTCLIPAGEINKQLLTSNVVPWNAVLFRKECLKKIPMIDSNLQGAYDWFFWVYAALAGCKFHQIDRIFGYIQKSQDSVQHEIERMSIGGLKCIEHYGKNLNIKDKLLYGFFYIYGFRLIRHGIICFENNKIRTGHRSLIRGMFFLTFSYRKRKAYLAAFLIWMASIFSDPRKARCRIENLFGQYFFRRPLEIERLEKITKR